MYARIENNTVVEWPIGSLQQRFPQISFPNPVPAASLPPGVVQVYPTPKPVFNPLTHELKMGLPYEHVGFWHESWEVVELSAEEQEARRTQMFQAFAQATQDRLDAFARTRGYDNLLSAISYATSTVSQYQSEALYCIGARDLTWQCLNTLQADIIAGSRPMPESFAAVEAELPALAWPV